MTDPAPLQLLMRDRQAGKTTAAIVWVALGERTTRYPGWSRVLVVPTMRRLDHIRREWWHTLDDFSHRVYTLAEWAPARGIGPDVEVCLDDLDTLLATGLPRLPGRIVAATITARPWHVDLAAPTAPRT